MDVNSAQSAREFADAWESHGERGRWMMNECAASQRACAVLARQTGHFIDAAAHDAAAEVLIKRAKREN